MEPREIKGMAEVALESNNPRKAFDVCRAVVDPEVFIGERASTETDWTGSLLRPATYATTCQGSFIDKDGKKRSCGKRIKKGETIVWIKGRGGWHPEHYHEGDVNGER